MTAPEFEARVVAWARQQPDLEALVQIGSRVQPGATVDAWSDWDYLMIFREPARYLNHDWLARIAPVWSAHHERTERGGTKLSAVFTDGWEVDFVLLKAWQIKFACWAAAHPGVQGWLPAAVRTGVQNHQLDVRSGYRVVLGGRAWEERYAAINTAEPGREFSGEDFNRHVAAFWRHAVWVAKKILRGELRAALRWSQVKLREHLYALLAEEARLAGRAPRPEARQAERWLDATRLQQTAQATGPEQKLLARALLADMTVFREAGDRVAAARGFARPDYAAIEGWLRTELGKLPG